MNRYYLAGALRLYTSGACQQIIKNNPEEWANYGCGPGGVGDYFVPDTVYGLSIKPACQRHDGDYRHSLGNSDFDRKEIDETLRDNGIRIVRYYTKNVFLYRLRVRRVKTYYYWVRMLGGAAYWDERNNPTNMMTV
jgi:hypothetical protein